MFQSTINKQHLLVGKKRNLAKFAPTSYPLYYTSDLSVHLADINPQIVAYAVRHHLLPDQLVSDKKVSK